MTLAVLCGLLVVEMVGMINQAPVILSGTNPAAVKRYSPPLYNITASSIFDAGRQHGKLAKDRIRGWFAGSDVQALVKFVKDGEGAAAYHALRRDSTTHFPLYAEELRGIAAGAELELDLVWTGILMIELQSLLDSSEGQSPCDAAAKSLNSTTSNRSSHATGARPPGKQRGENPRRTTEQHCTDITAVADGGFDAGFSHGHNEDWSQEVGEFYYYIKYTAAPGADFASCAGLAYPGALIGWGPTWNADGVFTTVNTLLPKRIKSSGVSTGFIQREAICGVEGGGGRRGIEAVVSGLQYRGWADGASINVVDAVERRVANVETYLDTHSTVWVPNRAGNSSHCNAYKHLSVDQYSCSSTVARQALLDHSPPPRTVDDVKGLLSEAPTLLRDITIANLVYSAETGRLEAWGGTAPDSTPPLYSWDLRHFFDPSP